MLSQALETVAAKEKKRTMARPDYLIELEAMAVI